LVACGPGYSVVRSDTGVSVSATTRFVVLPTSFQNASMYGRSFEEWREFQTAEQAGRWQESVELFEARFDARVADCDAAAGAGRGNELDAGSHGVRVRITELSRFAARGFLHGTIQLLRPDGRVFDEIYIEIEISGSFNDRVTMRNGGGDFADRLCTRLEERARSDGER